MRKGTERLVKHGQQHWMGQRAVNKRSNSIGEAKEAVSNRRNTEVGEREAAKNRSNNAGDRENSRYRGWRCQIGCLQQEKQHVRGQRGC